MIIFVQNAEHFEQVQDYLQLTGIGYEINEQLRGLDYYTQTVFEIIPNLS